MAEPDFSKKYLFDQFVKGSKKRQCDIIADIEDYAKKNSAFEENAAKWFVPKVSGYWKKCCRANHVFETRYEEYLKQNLYERKITPPMKRPATIVKSFAELSVSQKRRRTVELRKEDTDALLFASNFQLNKNGKSDLAKVINLCSEAPEVASQVLDILKRYTHLPKEVDPEKALAIALDCGLTKEKYMRLRLNSLDQASHQFPSYEKFRAAKLECYPENVVVEENEAVVPLQSLLDHTARRLILSLKDTVKTEKLILYHKWGFDGSSGHSEYKQVFQSDMTSDASVVITTMVPLRLVPENQADVVWENKSPSSTRFCRPIRIAYKKETPDNIKKEADRVMKEISNLVSTRVELEERAVEICHELLLTMIDGKTINTLEGNRATSRCYICDSGQKNMNNLSKCHNINMDRLKYGISPLHARIKFYEYVLHIAYRLALPEDMRSKGKRLNVDNKKLLQERKQKVQHEFRQQLGLIVDTPKPGFGSSNDGNTSRKFFDNLEISSKILGIDKEVMRRLHVILTAINIFQELDTKKFNEYALSTARLLNELYAFWPMRPTVHKVLLHGEEIMSHAILPSGVLSEEAMEHRNKDFKKFREAYARQMSRKDNITDVFNRFLLTSDPLINLLRDTKVRIRKKELPVDVLQLLKNQTET